MNRYAVELEQHTGINKIVEGTDKQDAIERVMSQEGEGDYYHKKVKINTVRPLDE